MHPRSIVVLFAITLAIPPALRDDNARAPFEKECNTMPAEAPPKMVDYRDYMRDAGAKLNCYFTIERLASTRDRRSPLDHEEITGGVVATTDALIAKLNAEMTGVTASRDKVNASIIHLTEDALLNMGGYDLNRKVSFKFQGTPWHMLDGLNQFHPTIGPRYSGGIPPEPQDFSTQIEVDVHDEPLRQVLTSAVPLPGYNRIIWDASTTIRNNEIYTSILYYGKLSATPPSGPIRKGYFIGPNQAASRLPYFQYLREVGEKLDCYFTFETNNTQPIERSGSFIVPGDDGTIDAVVAKLNKEFKRFRAVRDSAYPSVIHLTDVTLTAVNDYGLDRTVTVNYQGTIDGFLARLHQLLPAVGNARKSAHAEEGMKIGEFSDTTTGVMVDSRDSPLRQVLTSVVNLSGYKRTIWSAHTNLENGSHFTGIVFHGPKERKEGD